MNSWIRTLIPSSLVVLGVSSDLNPLWSSKTEGVAGSCDAKWFAQLGFTCDCQDLVVECRFRNITVVEDLDLPDETTKLDLSHNSLSSMSVDFLLFPYPIQELLLSHNQINQITHLTFASLHILQFLDLSYNQLTNLDSDVFSNLTRLLTLDLSHNRIQTLQHTMFPVGSSLQRLDVSYNPLHGVDGIEPSPIVRLSRLMYLDLANCSLVRLHVNFLHNNSDITALRLSKNNISYIPTTTLFDTRENLEFLDLTENPIPSVASHSFHGLYGLKTLVMNSMPVLESIEAHGFHDLHSLDHLECMDNPNLRHIHPLAFMDNPYQDFLPEISNVYLSNNALTTLSYDLINWRKVEDLNLGGNPWECNCELDWIPRIANLNSSWIFQLECSGPPELYGYSVSEAAELMKCEQSLEMSTIALMIILVLSITLLIVLTYLVVQRQWPGRMPRINLFGIPANSTSQHYLNLNQLSVISLDEERDG